MRKIYAIAALGLALLALGGTPVMAQDAAARDAAISSCTIPPVNAEACNAAIVRYIAIVKTLPPGQADNALADLVNALAASSSPATRDIISAAIVTVSLEFTDSVRANAAIQVADAVAAGQQPIIVVAQQASAN